MLGVLALSRIILERDFSQWAKLEVKHWLAKVSDTKDDWLLFTGPPINESFGKIGKKMMNHDRYHRRPAAFAQSAEDTIPVKMLLGDVFLL